MMTSMSHDNFASTYEYSLNFNYGKVVAGPNNPDTVVAVYDSAGKLAHRTCIGEMTLALSAQEVEQPNVYYSYFFGSPGYRMDDNQSWQFLCNRTFLMACVSGKQCWVVTNNGEPFVVSPTSPDYALLADIIKQKNTPSPNNVVSIRRTT
jgi:hypothetical protein